MPYEKSQEQFIHLFKSFIVCKHTLRRSTSWVLTQEITPECVPQPHTSLLSLAILCWSYTSHGGLLSGWMLSVPLVTVESRVCSVFHTMATTTTTTTTCHYCALVWLDLRRFHVVSMCMTDFSLHRFGQPWCHTIKHCLCALYVTRARLEGSPYAQQACFLSTTISSALLLPAEIKWIN